MLTTKMLTTKEIARKFGISHRTIENWRYRQVGPPFHRLQKGIRYDVDVFEEWTKRHTSELH